MKNKSTIILGVTFLVLVVIYLFTSLNPREVTRGAAPLFEGEKPDIDKIEINSIIRGHIVLEKQNGLWYLKEPFEYKAYDAGVRTMLTMLVDTVVDGVVSSNVDAHEQYLVSDSTGTSFKAYSVGELLLDVIIGTHSRNIGQGYARRAGSNDIELWRGMITQEVIREADEWRDREIYSYNEDDIINVEAVEADQTRTLALSDTVWAYTENGAEKTVDQNKVKSFARLLAKLQCDALASAEDINKVISKDPEIKVTFTVRNGNKLSFDLWKPDEEDRNKRYFLRKENGDLLYRFYPFRGTQLCIDYEILKPAES
jgi:hypothetical protein